MGNLAYMSIPLIKLKKNKMFHGNRVFKDAFKKIKGFVTNALYLALINYTDKSKELLLV